jgi:diguanylate cyclase
MTRQPPAGDGPTVEAMQHLAEIRLLTERTRARLKRLQHELTQTESALGNYRPLQPLESNAWLVEANNQLVVSALLARSEADSAASALQDAAHTAGHDALTGLPNRMLLMDRLAHAIALAKRQASGLAVLFLDIDAFKHINDTQGHGMGDEALKGVAACLLSCVREVDTVGRLGGDEFVIVLSSISGAADATLVAGKMIAALKTGYPAGDGALSLSASIGVSLFPEHGDDPAGLIHHADTAMYLAKKYRTGNWVFSHKKTSVVADDWKRAAGADEQPAHDTESRCTVTHLREANEQLVLASLNAQILQATAEHTQRVQTEFLTVAAHELRNPLAPLRFAASLLSRAPPEELPRLQAVIERQALHLARLVGDLLDIARSNGGRLHLNLQTVDVVALLLESVDICKPGMTERAQRLRVDVPAATVHVQADPVRFAQIICNLLGNAQKYTPVGGSIEVSLRVSEASVLITVSDDGIGIPAEALPGIFERFAQETPATHFNNEGLGVGLAVVRELVQSHGGDIVATSAGRNLGSQFSITLPLPPPGEAQPA